MHRATYSSTMPDPEYDGGLEDVRAVITFLKDHTEELAPKGVPVDAMIRDLERQIEVVHAVEREARDLRMQEQELARERVDRRRELDAIVAWLPPDLADGMSTLAYLAGITEREAERRRRGREGVGEEVAITDW
jgi:hypothetical protein